MPEAASDLPVGVVLQIGCLLDERLRELASISYVEEQLRKHSSYLNDTLDQVEKRLQGFASIGHVAEQPEQAANICLVEDTLVGGTDETQAVAELAGVQQTQAVEEIGKAPAVPIQDLAMADAFHCSLQTSDELEADLIAEFGPDYWL